MNAGPTSCIGRCHAVKIRAGGDVDDTDLNFRGRIRQRHIGPPFVLFGRVAADNECYANMMAS
jgi:hypothetical protein